MSGYPTHRLPAGPSPPSPAVSSGPQGAFRVTIVEEDLLRHGFPASDVADQIGDYTLALTDGSFRLHQRYPDGNTWETSGTYAITGDRITFTEWADAGCAGNRFSAVWRSHGAVLTLSDVSSEIRPRLRSAVREPLGPGRLRVASLDDRRGRDGRVTADPAASVRSTEVGYRSWVRSGR